MQGYEAWVVQPYTARIMSTLFPLLTLCDKFQNSLTVKISDSDFKLQSHSLMATVLNWWLQHSILEQIFYLFRRYPRNWDKFFMYLVTILQEVTWAKYSPQISLCLVNNKGREHPTTDVLCDEPRRWASDILKRCLRLPTAHHPFRLQRLSFLSNCDTVVCCWNSFKPR